jgi:hypothetical protein
MQNQPTNLIGSETPILVPEAPKSDSIEVDENSPATTAAPATNRKRTREDKTLDLGDDVRRSKRLRDKRQLQDELEAAMIAAALSTVHKVNHLIPIPRTYEEAINDPVYGPEWLTAVRNEIRQLIANGTFQEVRKPHRVSVVTAKWVFAVKYAPNGGVERFKARLVARGFTQIEGIDFKETFAPTIRADSLRILLAIIALEDLEAHQVDVNNAFTEAKLKETIFMKPPDGCDSEGMVWQLVQSLYGLKQAARDWYNLCSEKLKDMGFEPIPSDPCVFRNPQTGTIIGLYVDDLLIAARLLRHIKEFKSEFSEHFKIKDLGEIQKILGVRITRDRKNRTIYLDQSAYLNQMLRQYDMDHGLLVSTRQPMADNAILLKARDGDDMADKKEYQRQTGSVMHPMVYTRPDIAFAVGKLAQFMDKPTTAHEKCMKTLMRYLRSTIDLQIRYGPYGRSADRVLGFSDADYAGDRNDRKSTSGMIFILGGGAISWRSRKQHAVSTSTTEAEYIALSTGAKHGKWVAQFLIDIDQAKYVSENQRTIKIYGDNNASITLVDQPQVNGRSKHIDIAYHNVRDLRARNIIATEYVSTKRMIADSLTKPLPRDQFEYLRRKMGLVVSGSG